MALRTVTNHRDLLSLDEGEVGVLIVKNLGHDCSLKASQRSANQRVSDASCRSRDEALRLGVAIGKKRYGELDLFLVHVFKLVGEDLVKIQLTAVVGAAAICAGLAAQ